MSTKCEVCKNEVRVNSSEGGTSSYEPVNKKLVSIVKEYNIPFACPLCGSLHYNLLKPTRDVVFLWLIAKKVKKIGSIFLPDDDYVGGNTQERFGRYTAVVLDFGKKRFNKYKQVMKGDQDDIAIGDVVFYNRNIPEGWRFDFEFGNKSHFVRYCGIGDIFAIEESINGQESTT